MVSRGEVKVHVESFTKGMEEVGHEFGTSIGGDMRWNPMLGENMEDKQVHKLLGGDCIDSGDEDTWLCELVDDYQDHRESIRVGELLNEVHGDGVPGSLGDQKLLKGAERKVLRDFGACAGGTGLAVIADKELESRPVVVPEDESLRLVLTIMSSGGMIMM